MPEDAFDVAKVLTTAVAGETLHEVVQLSVRLSSSPSIGLAEGEV